MRKILYVLMLCCASVLHAQEISPRPSMSVLVAPTAKTITFLVRWVERIKVDSTVVSVYLSNDTIPVISRRGISPDTVQLTLPDDTTSYSFKLVSYLGISKSEPATAGFYFDASIYYRLVGLVFKPDSITVNPGEEVQFCTFMKFNDNTLVMRMQDTVRTICKTEYAKLPADIQATTGYKQRYTNKVCYKVQDSTGTIVSREPGCL